MLNRVLCDVDGKSLDNDALMTVLAVGPITKQPLTSPYRVVLRLVNNTQFVVHNEIWPDRYKNPDGTLHVAKSKSGYVHGAYFNDKDLDKAVAEFARRVNKPDHMRSVYRG